MLPLWTDWIPTLSLIFGGCCTNVIALEQLTAQHPNAGPLLTFLQFLVVALYGVPKNITYTYLHLSSLRIPIPQLRPRKIHIAFYIIQVFLFYAISLLNNAAFAYHIPMAVHIIFRSGGLVISMLLGWAVSQKSYNITQVFSVLLVTAGVILTTLSVPQRRGQALQDNARPSPDKPHTYTVGVCILAFALFLSGLLGLVQDWTYSLYGRPIDTQHTPKNSVDKNAPPAWQESMFYLHFLALPMFLSVRHDLASQLRSLNAGPFFHIPFPPRTTNRSSPPNIYLSFPRSYVPLILNTLTQLLCVSGVHRLTTRVSALTVTLVLVVRKAASFVISVLWLRGAGHSASAEMPTARWLTMWLGAGLVLLGTVGYSVASTKKNEEAPARAHKDTKTD